MSKKLPFTISRGCAYDRSRAYVLAYSSSEEGTRVFRWFKGWGNYYIDGKAADICCIDKPEPEILVLCLDGMIHSAGPSGQGTDFVAKGDDSPIHRGMMRAMQPIGDCLYAVGIGRQVYRRDENKVWHRCDDGVLEPKGAAGVSGFETIDGFGQQEVYAAGWNGEVWTYDSRSWNKIDSLTNIIFQNAVCAPDGSVYIVGQLGIIVKGRGQSWQLIEQDVTEETFWDSTWFEDHLWMSTKDAVYRLEENDLARIDMKLDFNPTCRYLYARDGQLWSFGGRDTAVYNGSDWKMIPSP